MNPYPTTNHFKTFNLHAVFKNRILLSFIVTISFLALSSQASVIVTGKKNNATTVQPSIIPVRIINFSCRVQNDIVSIKWVTSSEKNINHFVLEKSVDDINFNFINKQTGRGINKDANLYIAEDFKPATGINYYRLKIVCNDGSIYYSKNIVVNYKLK